MSVLQPALDFLMLLFTVKHKGLIMADQLSDLVKPFKNPVTMLAPFECVIVTH